VQVGVSIALDQTGSEGTVLRLGAATP
jgi:hypothetical protein